MRWLRARASCLQVRRLRATRVAIYGAADAIVTMRALCQQHTLSERHAIRRAHAGKSRSAIRVVWRYVVAATRKPREARAYAAKAMAYVGIRMPSPPRRARRARREQRGAAACVRRAYAMFIMRALQREARVRRHARAACHATRYARAPRCHERAYGARRYYAACAHAARRATLRCALHMPAAMSPPCHYPSRYQHCATIAA